MPVEVESTSQIEEFRKVLRKRLWWILLPASVCVALGVCFAIVVPKKYVTKTRVMVRNTLPGDAPGRGGSNSAREAQVAGHQIRSPARISAVLQELRWPEFLELNREEQYEYVQNTQENVTVDIPLMPEGSGQQVVRMSFGHTDPLRAYQFLVSLREKWQAEVLERGQVAEAKAFESVKETKGTLERERDEITEELARWRKEHRIAPPEAVSRPGQIPTYDPVFEDLPNNKNEMNALDLSTAEMQERIAGDRTRWARMPDTVPSIEEDRGVRYGKEIQDKELEILQIQQKINERGYKPLHPRYRQLQERIATLRGEIEILRASEVEATETKIWVANKKKATLRQKIDEAETELERMRKQRANLERLVLEQEERALELQDVYSHIRTLESRLDRVNEQLKQVDSSFQQKKATVAWIQGPGGDPFEILEKVHLPTTPTEPNPALIVIFSIFAGVGIGLGLAVISEYSKNCFRSVNDISRIMVVPVLGTVNAIVTRREARRTASARLIGSAISLLFIATLGYVTWAWKERPQLLSQGLLDVIEGFRNNFK